MKAKMKSAIEICHNEENNQSMAKYSAISWRRLAMARKANEEESCRKPVSIKLI